MKRFKERLVNFRVVIVAIISLIIGIAIGIFCFCHVDTTPATEADLKSLQDQRIVFETNHVIPPDSDGTVEIKDDLTLVKFENDECLLTATYNEDFEAISITTSDKAESLPLTIFVSLFMCIGASLSIFVLILLIIDNIDELITKIQIALKTNS